MISLNFAPKWPESIENWYKAISALNYSDDPDRETGESELSVEKDREFDF